MKNSVDKVFGVNLPDCLGVDMEISKPLPSQATIPRKSIQKEFTNERTYQKTRLSTKPNVARNLKKNSSVANLKMITDPNSLEEIIPRLSGFPMEGRTVQVAGHDDS